MKVTKLIREYVEEQVAKVYDGKQNPYAEQAEKDRQMLKEFEETLKTQQVETIRKFASENELFTDEWTGVRPYKIATNIPSFSYVLTQAIIDEKNWKKENLRLKNAKTREIIVNLELGASKAELDAMLAALLEENK